MRSVFKCSKKTVKGIYCFRETGQGHGEVVRKIDNSIQRNKDKSKVVQVKKGQKTGGQHEI